MLKEKDLLENSNEREKLLDNVSVLEKVKDLILLGDTELATTQQVAEYYEISKSTLEALIKDNRKELLSNGLTKYKKNEIIRNLLKASNVKSQRTKAIVTLKDGNIIEINNTGMNLFQKRTILNVGMLLRDSEVAKEVRRRLLDITQDVLEGKEVNKELIINEIDEEKQLMLNRVEAEMNGDYDTVSIINAKLFAIKNERIKDLENEIDVLKTHALTLTESRDVINRLMRIIACKEFDNFGKAYNELYKQLNYKLKINIKSRNKNKNQSYIDLLNEEETFETEKIVKIWANDLGINIEKELSLAN